MRAALPAVVLPALVLVALLPLPGHAQDQKIDGKCNVQSSGSNNTYIINCGTEGAGGAAPRSQNLLVVVGQPQPVVVTWQPNGMGGWMPFNFFPNVVDVWSSHFTVEIADEAFSTPLGQQFDGGNLRLEDGSYPFLMMLELVYTNGFSQSVRCRGAIRAESSATLLPQFHVGVDPGNGNVHSLSCGFVANPA